MSIFSSSIGQSKIKQRIINMRILITSLHVAFVLLSFYLIFKEDRNILSNNLIVKLDPKFYVLLFLSFIPIFIDILAISVLVKPNPKACFSNKKINRDFIINIIFNIVFASLFFSNLTYGYITQDTINLKNIYCAGKEYNYTDVKHVDIDLKYKSATNNYFIDYYVNFKDNTDIELSDFNNCSYEKLMLINNIAEKNGVIINRDEVSDKTRVKVLEWCNKYPDNLEAFNHLLDLNHIQR
jgi:hypothetical protein